MPKQQLRLLAPVFGAAMVVCGGIGNVAYAENKLLLSSSGIVASTRLVPQKVLMSISLATDGVTWSQLDRFHTPKTKKLFDLAIATFIKEGFPKNDFAKEIQPWLGNVTMAVLPGSVTPQQGGKYPYSVIIVTEIKDQGAVEKYLEKEKQRDGAQVLQQKDYKGIQITKIDYKTENPSVYAFVDRFLVFTEQRTSLEQAIDAYKDGKSILTALAADRADLLELKHPALQIYMPNFAESIQQLNRLHTDTPEIPPEAIAQLKKVRSVNLGIGIDEDGIRLKAITKLDLNTTFEYKPAPGKVISLFPAETFALITGNNIKHYWQQFARDAERLPELKSALSELRQGLKSPPFQIDLDKDIFGWMDGEFGLGGITAAEGILGQFGAAPVLVLQTSDRRAAEALWRKLEKLLKDSGVGTVGTKNIKGIPVTQWSFSGSPEPALSYGWYANDSFFITIGNQLVSSMTAKYSESLLLDSDFRAATSSLTKPNLGYFYLDMDKTRALIEKNLPEETKSEIPPEANAILGRIRGLGITSNWHKPDTSKLEVLLSLKSRGLHGVWY